MGRVMRQVHCHYVHYFLVSDTIERNVGLSKVNAHKKCYDLWYCYYCCCSNSVQNVFTCWLYFLFFLHRFSGFTSVWKQTSSLTTQSTSVLAEVKVKSFRTMCTVLTDQSWMIHLNQHPEISDSITITGELLISPKFIMLNLRVCRYLLIGRWMHH